PQFGAHSQNRLGFGAEIECVVCFVVINPVHAVAVVEEQHSCPAPIHQEAMKSSVQSCRKRFVFLVKMNKIRGSYEVNVMPLLSETLSHARLWKFFPRERENDLSRFIPQGHSVREGAPSRHPSDVDSGGRINPGARSIEGLVAKGLDHLGQ